MHKNKLDFKSIKTEAIKMADNESIKKFINGAHKDRTSDLTAAISNIADEPAKEVKLVVEGLLKNRNEICQKPIQFYIKKDIMKWINKHAASGRGGQQIMLNFLLKKGIESIEKEYSDRGVIFANE